MAAAVATAESALRAEMAARGDGADADDTIARIRAEPARFKDQQNAVGELARKLIEKAEQDARMDVDPVVVDNPLPRPGQSSSTAVEIDVSWTPKSAIAKRSGAMPASLAQLAASQIMAAHNEVAVEVLDTIWKIPAVQQQLIERLFQIPRDLYCLYLSLNTPISIVALVGHHGDNLPAVYPIQCTAEDLPTWFFNFMEIFLPADLPERFLDYCHDGQGGLPFDFHHPEAVVDLYDRLSDSDKDSVRIAIGDDFNAIDRVEANIDQADEFRGLLRAATLRDLTMDWVMRLYEDKMNANLEKLYTKTPELTLHFDYANWPPRS